MENVRTIFRFKNENERGIVGIYINVNEKTLEVNQVKGNAISLDSFLQLIETEEFAGVLDYLNEGYVRVNPFRIDRHVGMSGNSSYYLEYVEGVAGVSGNFPVIRRVDLLYLSMYDKLNCDAKIFIPDLLELIPILKENHYLSELETEFQELIPECLENFQLPLRQFTPIMAYYCPDSRPCFENYEKGAEQKGLNFFNSFSKTGYAVVAEYILDDQEYSAMKEILTRHREEYEDFHLYENEKDIFVYQDHKDKTILVVMKEDDKE